MPTRRRKSGQTVTIRVVHVRAGSGLLVEGAKRKKRKSAKKRSRKHHKAGQFKKGGGRYKASR